MIDLERELRATLDEHAGLAPPPVDTRPAIRVARRRQLGVVLTALAVIAAVVVGSVAGVSALIRSSERRVPVEPPDTFSAGPPEAVPTGFFNFENLTVDADGNVWWIGPGLTRFDPDSGAIRTFTRADDRAFQDIWSIVPAREGGVWMLSPPPTSIVRRSDGEGLQEVLGPSPVCDLAAAPDGTLWGSGCEGGAFHWDGASWVPAPSADDTPLGSWEGRQEGYRPFPGRIVVDAGGHVWVANTQYGSEGQETGASVSRLDGSTWTTWTDLGPPIVAGPSGEVWVGKGDGFARFLDGGWVTYPKPATVPGDFITVTDEGVLWVGGWTDDGGRIARLDGTSWTTWTGKGVLEGIEASHPKVAAGEEGAVWAATDDTGLSRFDGTRWERVVPSGLGPAALWYGIAGAGPEELWTIGYPYEPGAGPWRLRGGTWTSFRNDPSLPRGTMSGIAVGPDGAAWLSTEQGLARFDGSGWQRVPTGSDPVVAFGPDGRVWSASGDGATIAIQPIGESALPGPVPLQHTVTRLGIGPGGEVWASCWAWWGGEDCRLTLAHFDGRAWETVEPPAVSGEPGLIDLEVTSEGDVWISVGDGGLVVMRYRNGAWDVFREPATGLGFDPPSELGSAEGQLDSTTDGTLLLVTEGGIAAFHDDSWAPVVEGRSEGLSVAPDGTIWLTGDGLFRMTSR